MKITPARIADEIRKRDSIKLAKDEERARRQLLNSIKEETGIDSEQETATPDTPPAKPKQPANTNGKTVGLLAPTDEHRKRKSFSQQA